MKNIHLIESKEKSTLLYNPRHKSFCIRKEPDGMWINDGKVSGADFWSVEKAMNNGFYPYNIYITSDEEVKEGDWTFDGENPYKWTKDDVEDCLYNPSSENYKGCKKIILTTDQDLIKDGVQAIDDEFLEWFVMNPSCEFVKTELVYDYEEHSELTGNPREEWSYYKIIIPQEEPNQETLEEAAEKYVKSIFDNGIPLAMQNNFIAGAKWQAKRMYSEEGVLKILRQFNKDKPKLIFGVEEWFEQIKKK